MKYARVSLVLGVLALLCASAASGFMPAIHEDISQESVEGISRTVDGETLEFQDRAIEQIREANADTDSLFNGSFFNGPSHFTEESFAQSSRRLRNLKQEIIDRITASSPDGEAARQRLGTALHTLQDFYAHSNWVELGRAGINQDLGRNVMRNPPAATAFCPTNDAVLGGAGLTSLTTVYYEDLNGCGPIPAGKCRHGTWLPPSACLIELCDGIAKDKPCLPNHAAARGRALAATTDYVNQILDDSAVAGNAKAIKALMGINGTLGFIIDDTGSMGPEISQVKQQVAQIVDSVRDTDDAPEQYLLVRFGDPDVGSPFTTADPDAFLAAVNGLSPSGGGDCPELSMTATLRAIGASRSDSTLYLFTDASAKDSSLAGSVSAAARAKRIRVSYLLTGSCSPIDPGYRLVADETGGQLFELFSFELGRVFDLIRPQLTGDFVTVLSARDTLSSGSREYAVPVDSTMTRAVFSVAIDSKDSVRVVRPSGVPVDPAVDPDADLADLSSGCIITMTDPVAGIWRLEVEGSGALSVDVKGNSPLELRSFDFVALAETVHGGYFPLEGQPPAGEPQIGLARVLGPFATADFRLIDETGATLQTLSFAAGDPEAAADELVGTVDLPGSAAFRVAVSGADDTGALYQRIFPERFRGQLVVINVDPSTIPLALVADTVTTLSYTVRNLGPLATFSVQAADDRGLVSGVSPPVLTLGGDEEATVEVTLTVPAGVAEGDVSLAATVTNVVDPTVNNSSSLVLPLIANQPPDCSAAVASRPELWPPNHRLQAIEILEIVDPDGDDVTVVIESITQDEPVLGPGSGSTAPDGAGIGESTAQVRAERAGVGNGRVYRVGFAAADGAGGVCQGEVSVSVPKSRNGEPAIDDGQLFDSTQSE